MSAQENVALAREIYGLFNRHEFDRVLEHVSEDAEVEVYYAEVKSLHSYSDNLTVMGQLGLMPAPEQAQA